MNDPKNIYFCSNGNVMAFDAQGEQIPELQQAPWIKLYFKFLKSKGFHPEDIEKINFYLPDKLRAQYDAHYDNWEIL